MLTTTALAAGIGLYDPRIEADGDGYSLSADFGIGFPAPLATVIDRGIVLHFVVDFELTRSRWYWFDEQVVSRKRTYRLSYHALTRQYRLSTGGLHQGFATLDEALRVLERLRNWQVVGKGEISPDTVYQAALRMRLDLSQMPKTFQVSALSSADWNLSSDWRRWRFKPVDVVADKRTVSETENRAATAAEAGTETGAATEAGITAPPPQALVPAPATEEPAQ